MKVTVEGNAKIPVFSNRGFAGLVFSRVGGSVRTNATLDQTSVSLPGPPVGPTGSDYKVSVENLPDSYSIKSIGYGSTDLRSGDLHIPAAYFNAPSGSPPPSGTPLNTINLVLRMVRTDDPSGVRVSGRVNNFRTPRSIYISGNPGSLYSDGTFEFRGVPPGRHVILTGNNPSSARPVGAMIVVGNGDVTGVLLEEMLLLPPDFKTPTAPVPDARAPGTIIHLASVHGRVIEETTQQPIADGILYVGEYLGVQERAVMRLPSDGRFEISHLLPGSYKLEILVFGHTTIRQTFEVDEKDVDLELTSRKLY
jgi:hypothetical protein